MEDSKIQWTDNTFNPWRGCTKVAAGCANCYAETLSKRNHGTLGIWGPNGTRVLAAEAMWREPVKWDRAALESGARTKVFCASLADVFEDWRQPLVNARGDRIQRTSGAGFITMSDARSRLFRLIDATPNLDWLLLTKRPGNIPSMLDGRHENLWIGTSVAIQADADKNIPELLKCRDMAAKLFVSAEPLIAPVDIALWIDGIDLAIVGGESGAHARPCNVEWIRSLVRQCGDAGVPAFVKQLGANVVEAMLRDLKGGDMSEWPADLRVREWPSSRQDSVSILT